MKNKKVVHLTKANHLTVACGEFNHMVKHSPYRNRVTCQKCLKAEPK